MYAAFKRLIDILVSAVSLILFAPLMAILGVLIASTMGLPVLFRQVRAGYHGISFELLKFRTMRDATGPGGNPLPDGERLTRLGRFLRNFSLDEIPQLWNVLKGDMSLVGPRPLLADYLPRYSSEQARRHDVKPGITGWAQVNGRNALSWDRKFELDVWYVNHWSLGLDAKILWRTIRNVFQRKGISLDGHATMPEFTGNDQGVS